MGSSSLIGVLALHADQAAVSLPASRRASLVEALTAVPDRRDPRGVVHPLAGVLASAVAAVLAGARSAAAVAEWAADAPQPVLAGLGVWRDPFTGVYRAPDESTFRRILAGVDADALDDAVGRWIIASRPQPGTHRRVYSVDGKTLRGVAPPVGRCISSQCWTSTPGPSSARSTSRARRTNSPGSSRCWPRST